MKRKCYLKRVTAAALVAAAAGAALCGCSQSGESSGESGDEKLKYYYVADSGDLMCEYIRRYNLYCDESYDDSYKIETVEFDSPDEMLTKLSTEIMAGGGCDILTTYQGLAFEKLLQNGTAADVDELANRYDYDLGISECIETVMDAGVINGKRLAVPLACSPNFFVTTEKTLEKYGVTSEGFSFEKLYEGLKKSGEEYSLLGYSEYNKDLFYYFLDGYVDFENKTCGFESDEFSEKLDTMYNLIEGDTTDDEKFYSVYNDDFKSVLDATGSSFEAAVLYYTNILYNGATPTAVSASEMPSLSVDYAFAVNNNCKNKEKLLPFIKYCLSERGQGRMYKSEDLTPVNTASFNDMLEETDTYVDFDDDGSADENETALYEKALEMAAGDFKNAMNNAEVCTLYSMNFYSENYYNTQVINDVVSKYLSGEISKDKFISQLTSTTQTYLNE